MTRPALDQALKEARRLIAVWFYGMEEDAYDGRYDCTCGPGDPCPFHRVVSWLSRYGGQEMRARVKGLPGWLRGEATRAERGGRR